MKSSFFNKPAVSVVLLFFLIMTTTAAFGTTKNDTPTTTAATHLVILVHGWMGNDRELGYLQDSMERQAQHTQPIVFHSAKCNLKRTGDGIVKGGDRLVEEVMGQINNIDGSVLLSFVGNSLGGLYARYAIAHIDFSEEVVPFIFCTTATPHLGVSNNTYVSIPSWLEYAAGNALGSTGRDLFCLTPIVEDMGTTETYLVPLRKFQKRIAMANAFGTDFQVPTTTAAFLSDTSTYPHKTLLPTKVAYKLSVETKAGTFEIPPQKDVISFSLDALGWTKIFVDVRDKIPMPWVPCPFATEPVVPIDQPDWSSQELLTTMSRFGRKWKLPLGHMVFCANSRDRFNSWFNSNGRPIMDQLAMDILGIMATTSRIGSVVEDCESPDFAEGDALLV
jgi:hypothetical protein